jgi:hypothetical protein
VSFPAELEIEVAVEPAHHKYFDLNGAGAVQLGFSVVLYGYTLVNPSSSATAALNLYDGGDTTGNPIFPVTFAASESIGDWFGPNGIWLRNGLYANVTSGEVKGAVFYRHVRL